MSIFKKNDIYLDFELYGGTHRYDLEKKLYTINRPYGIFSNLTVCIYGIFLLEEAGYKVENIEFILNEYIQQQDLYSLLFEKKDTVIDLDKFTREDVEIFKSRFYPTFLGLGHQVVNINFEITSQIIDRFFSPSKNVVNLYNNILAQKNISTDDLVFIWARKTDKVRESRIPEVDQYIKILKENFLLEKQILIQTDDKSVFDSFMSENIKFEFIDKIPFSRNGDAFHGRLDLVPDEEFLRIFGLDKTEYIMYMIVTSLIAKNSKYCILYPGNPTTYIPILKKTYDNCFLFTNDTHYYKL